MTQQMNDNPGVIENVVETLAKIDVDGETLKYIIEQLGMNNQMLRQLIMDNPESDIKDLLDEKITLSNKGLINKCEHKNKYVAVRHESGFRLVKCMDCNVTV